MSPDSQLSGL